MIERVVISALTMGTLAFTVFWYQYSVAGASLESSRNIALLFLVMFENIQVFNSRSETRSAFRHNPLRNPLLLFGTITAQLVHIGACYTPWLSDVLQIQPVNPHHWLLLLGLALSVLVVMELHKVLVRWLAARHKPGKLAV